jgi:hypothetical protein
MRCFLPPVTAALAAVACAALLPLAGAAHESRDTPSGQYSLEVGFLNEPAYLVQPNAVFLKVVAYGSEGGPVESLAATLRVDVQKDAASATFELLPGAEPGEYVAAFIPTSTGDYTFRVYGQVEEEAVDESFRSSPNTFAAVEPLGSNQFPVQPPDAATLQQEVEDAEDAADGARALALGGIAIGALGVLVGLAGWLRSGRRPSPRPAGAATASPPPDQPPAADPNRLVARGAVPADAEDDRA